MDLVANLIDVFLGRFTNSGYFFLRSAQFRHSALLPLPFGHRDRPSPVLLSAVYLWASVLSHVTPELYTADASSVENSAYKSLFLRYEVCHSLHRRLEAPSLSPFETCSPPSSIVDVPTRNIAQRLPHPYLRSRDEVPFRKTYPQHRDIPESPPESLLGPARLPHPHSSSIPVTSAAQPYTDASLRLCGSDLPNVVQSALAQQSRLDEARRRGCCEASGVSPPELTFIASRPIHTLQRHIHLRRPPHSPETARNALHVLAGNAKGTEVRAARRASLGLQRRGICIRGVVVVISGARLGENAVKDRKTAETRRRVGRASSSTFLRSGEGLRNCGESRPRTHCKGRRRSTSNPAEARLRKMETLSRPRSPRVRTAAGAILNDAVVGVVTLTLTVLQLSYPKLIHIQMIHIHRRRPLDSFSLGGDGPRGAIPTTSTTVLPRRRSRPAHRFHWSLRIVFMGVLPWAWVGEAQSGEEGAEGEYMRALSIEPSLGVRIVRRPRAVVKMRRRRREPRILEHPLRV
ncbi:hypothetical protein C8R45DRAFT_1110291 [Mycena sanguinolenta]|nr:hypothetical protein C8R45DRAFT_1110291 [Mycena sanguinolenta]